MRPSFFEQAERTLTLLRDLVHQHTGLWYDPDRLGLLADKLAPLLEEHRLSSYLDYYYLLKYESGFDEWKRVLSALTVNETYFWREPDQIETVAEVIVPRLQRERTGTPVRIWHAACASGEEPYSMAMALHAQGAFERGPIEIVATDGDESALARARHGTYRPRSFRALPSEMKLRWFSQQGDSVARLHEELRERVRFHFLNLMDERGMRAMMGFDVIFCRNVFIYFSPEGITRVARWLHDALLPASHLFVGASESLLKLDTPFELVEVEGAFAYRRP